MEQLDELNVIVGLLEVFLQEDVDTRFKDERVVDSNHANTLTLVPTGLTTTSDRGIHNIIGNQKEGLKLSSP